MSFHRSALLALALAGSATGCRDRCDRNVGVTAQKPVAGEVRATNAETVAPSPSAASNIAPPVAPTPAPPAAAPQPAPPAAAPQRTPPVVVVQQATPPPAETPMPVSPPYAPTAPATINDAGIVVPAVPLYIDPGAVPGSPGNGAPDPRTNGQR
jgi:hypothetical protein